MLKISVSLWSADLVNLAADIRRIESYADSFHIDVADGVYAPVLLFFPDLLAAIRRQTRLPLVVHLIMRHPERWIAPFKQAGADGIVFYPDTAADAGALAQQIRAMGLRPGLSLALHHSVDLAEGLLDSLDCVVVLGTEVGVRGVQAPAPATYDKIRRLAAIRARRGLSFEIEADGAIRRETVPLLREAGADVVVPGSLMFQNDPATISRWIRSL